MPYRFVILAIIYIEMLIVSLGIQFIPPLMMQFIACYSLSDAQCGILMGIFSLFGLFFCIPIGLFSYRIGYKRVSIISLLLLVIGTGSMNLVNNFYGLCFFRMIAGAGIMTLAITLPSMLFRWFNRSEHGRIMGAFNTALPVGSIISFIFLGQIAKSVGISYIIWAITLISLAGLILFAVFYRVPADDKPKVRKVEKYSILQFLKDEKNSWRLGAIWLFYNAATISFSTFAIAFFYNAGYSIVVAGLITSTVVFGPLIFSPILGFLIDKGLNASIVLIAGNLILSIGFICLYIGMPISLSTIILGIGAGFVPTAVYYYVPRVVEPQKVAIAFGLVMAMLNAGILIGPYLVGVFMDLSSKKNICFFVMAVFSVFAVYPAYKLSVNK